MAISHKGKSWVEGLIDYALCLYPASPAGGSWCVLPSDNNVTINPCIQTQGENQIGHHFTGLLTNVCQL